jgi:hypothetical protein
MESSKGFLHRVPDQNSETQFVFSFSQATGKCCSKPAEGVFNDIFGNFLGQFLVILIFILSKVNPRNLMVTFVLYKTI